MILVYDIFTFRSEALVASLITLSFLCFFSALAAAEFSIVLGSAFIASIENLKFSVSSIENVCVCVCVFLVLHLLFVYVSFVSLAAIMS